jgi:outer membrane protein TolC
MNFIKIIFSLLLFAFTLQANQVLSKTQTNILNLSQQKIKEDSSKLKKDWINPINYSFIYLNDELKGVSKKSIISINQPIFRSGGIYYGIKYANNLQNSSTLAIDIQRKELISKTLNIVYNIKKLDLQIKKQKYLIQNNKIDLKIKKESVFNGLLSITFLNNAIITLNKTKLAIINLQYSRDNLIANLLSLSDLKYDKIQLPILKMLSMKEFEKNNIYTNQDSLQLKSKQFLKGITNAKYLPSVNLTYTKTISHLNSFDNGNYGLNINIPLNITTFNDMQSAKLEVLKQKEQNRLNSLSQKIFLKIKKLSIKSIKNKIALTKENINSYKKLLEQTQELQDAGLKTFDDIVLLKNSLKNEQLDINIYKIDEQIELLDIYKRVFSDRI